MAHELNSQQGRVHPQSSGPVDFNAMLARSIQPQEDPAGQIATSAPPTTGYEGVYTVSSTGFPDASPIPGPAAAKLPPPVLPTELPPQAFLTSAMLLDFIDKKINVVLRDDKTFVGILRSYDQYGNLVMTETVERLFVRNPEHNTSDTVKSWLIADCYQGVVAVRGENVAVAGVVDLDQEDDIRLCVRAPEDRVRELLAEQKLQKKADNAKRSQTLRGAGLEPDFGMEG